MAARLASFFAAALAAGTFLAVAPFSCDEDGWCHGAVAFEYGPSSAGMWQAIGAAALVGGVAWLLVWLAASPERNSLRGARVAVSALLVAGGAISLLSHSLLVLAGPLGAGFFLWLMWARDPRGRATFEVVVLATLVAIGALYLFFPVSTIVQCGNGCEVVGRRSAAGLDVPHAFTYLVPAALAATGLLAYRWRARTR